MYAIRSYYAVLGEKCQERPVRQGEEDRRIVVIELELIIFFAHSESDSRIFPMTPLVLIMASCDDTVSTASFSSAQASPASVLARVINSTALPASPRRNLV